MKIDSIALNYARLRRRLPGFQVYVANFVDGDRQVRAVGATWKNKFGPITSVVPIEGDPMACLRFLLANLVVETRTEAG